MYFVKFMNVFHNLPFLTSEETINENHYNTRSEPIKYLMGPICKSTIIVIIVNYLHYIKGCFITLDILVWQFITLAKRILYRPFCTQSIAITYIEQSLT